MKFFIVLLLAVFLYGCNDDNTEEVQVGESQEKVRIVPYEEIEVVCLERGSYSDFSFSCWGYEDAPKKIKEMLEKRYDHLNSPPPI